MLVLIVDVVAPVLHANVAEPVPPDGFAVSVAEMAVQDSGLCTVAPVGVVYGAVPPSHQPPASLPT